MWEVHYSDGTYISSEDNTPYSIEKRTDVQVIIQEDDEKRWKTLCKHDYYMWDTRGGNAQWFGGSDSGYMQYMMKPGYKCVLFGYHIDKKRFREIFNNARERFGEKAGFEADEQRPNG